MGETLMQSQYRTTIIKELHRLAEQVLQLKETHRQKRPIVIEFSGSPKSGKTSCINSLELFLKRNNFKVQIIQERASVCPIHDKHSPMFNIWTSCTSLAGMIGVLERREIDCDVLILDRGIFDALCWFNWLSAKKMMELEQKKTVESFLLMDALVNRIDIVFAFHAKPEISIEREYASLLTDKLGTIMNTEVLSEYLVSIKNTIIEKKRYFHSVFDIDTSKKTQNEVSKEVTDKTLETLLNLLMEQIGYFELTNKDREALHQKRAFTFSELNFHEKNLKFDLRNKVEDNGDLIQPLPIVVITDEKREKVLAIKKSPKAVSQDSPEKDKLLLYVGGHPRYEDSTEATSQNFLSVCKCALRREVREEIGISIALNNIEPFLIYTPDSDKSKKHLGVCFIVELDITTLKLRLDPHELILNKGTSKSGKFLNISEIHQLSDQLEPWSIEILKHYFDIDINIGKKPIQRVIEFGISD